MGPDLKCGEQSGEPTISCNGFSSLRPILSHVINNRGDIKNSNSPKICLFVHVIYIYICMYVHVHMYYTDTHFTYYPMNNMNSHGSALTAKACLPTGLGWFVFFSLVTYVDKCYKKGC